MSFGQGKQPSGGHIGWNVNCKYAPLNKSSKHCKKGNTGRKTMQKIADGKNVANKGYFGCATKCRFFESKNNEKGQDLNGS